MGGIAFKLPEDITESKQFLPSHSKEVWFINNKGIELLLKQADYYNIISNISKKEIKSKSKANGVAKTLICIQALWFMAQCITRRICDRKISKLCIIEIL